MLRLNTPALIEPPVDGAKVRPYAATWPRLIALVLVFGAVTGVLQTVRLLSPALLSASYLPITTIVFSLFPLALWTVLSIVQERQAAQPRVPLLSIGFTAFLTTYTLVLPLIDRGFAINQWLPLASAVDRILGYTVTVGISQAGIVYALVMLLAWRNHLRNRDDVVAYCMTVAIAYASAENLYSLMQGSPLLDAAAIRFFSNLALSIASGLVLAYGLTQTRFDGASSVIMPFTLILSAILIGTFTPLQSGLISASLSLEPTAPRPLLGLALAAVVLVAGMTITNWLLTSAENRAREVETVVFMDELS